MLIGLDLGTSTVTGVLFDAERAAVPGVASRRNDSRLAAEPPSRAEQDPGRVLILALEVVKELAATGLPVDGIGLTGQMHGLMCVDAAGEPLTPFISWQDQRTAEPLPGGGTTLDRVRALAGDLPWRENGCRIEHGYGAATLFWLAESRALPAGTRWVCTLPGWLAAKLTGRPPVTDPSLACSWGIYNVPKGDWNEALVHRLGLDRRLFPAVWPSGERLGELAPAAAQQVGLPQGVPVFNALGDHQASFLASVAEPATSVLVNLGTGGQVAWLVREFVEPTDQIETRPFLDKGYLRVGSSLCGGEAYAWLNRTVRRWLAEFGCQVDEETAYSRLNAVAEDASTTAGLHVQTTFLGVRGRPKPKGGAIEGITLDNLTLGALAKATLLGIADELYELYRGHTEEAARHRVLVASGNAVQKNPMLREVLEQRFGLPVEPAHWPEPAAVGAAMAARR